MSIRAIAWAWDQKLDPITKLVLIALADHSDDFGRCWPGIIGIAAKTGLSRRSIQRHLRDLEQAGLIRTKVRLDSSKRQTSSTYTLAITEVRREGVRLTPRDDTGVTLEGVTSDAPGGVRLTPKPSIRTVKDEPSGGARKRATPAPSDFLLTEQMFRWALDLGLEKKNIAIETDNFLDHHRAIGTSLADWDAGWRKWMRKAATWAADRLKIDKNDGPNLPWLKEYEPAKSITRHPEDKP